MPPSTRPPVSFLPVTLRLESRQCLVVGGGDAAAHKVSLLIGAGAAVRVVATELCAELRLLLQTGRIGHEVRPFCPEDLVGCALVIAATDDEALGRQVSQLARATGLPVNVVDHPELSSFVMPSVLDRSPLTVAISTGGASPMLARLLRARLETLVPSAYGRLAALMQSVRDPVRHRFPDVRERRRFWESVLSGPIAEMIFAGQDQAALAALQRQLEGPREISHQGEVYLVGGGPGDPDLLTFRALRLMQQADVVLYDRLVAPAIVELCRKEAERIYVGKEMDRHAVPQQEMNELLVRLAKQGKRVLRLKGGDPFIFGRGGEEIDRLAEAGVSFQVVPGITAASGCAAYSGIPLTHRDYAQSCVFVTAHLKEGKLELNWRALAQPRQTLAVYMGVQSMDVLCRALVEHGMSASTPAAVIERGTTARQRVFVGDLGSMPRLIDEHGVQPPAMAIIGEVVKLREKLAWYGVGGDVHPPR
ncbi:MAG: uroporphyrinogen-III C-methyltransferase [Polyangiaceae bacterium]|nr:uroporphyrinogen-III C-methyltransferase [Polyangiaceae bacterium]